jgi:hydrogenase/urease accessory protein HupE
MRPAYLGLHESAPETFEAVWKVPARGINERLALYVRFSDDTETVGEPVGGFAAGSYVERWRIRRSGGLTGATITIDGLASTMTDVLVRLERADGTSLSHRITPDSVSWIVPAEPSLVQVAWTYLALGVEHILLGIDHLLFVLALILVVDGTRKLIGTITAFTVAHSITLGLATLGFVHIPGPPVEAVIALSIVFVAAEIVHGRQGRPGLTARSPWIVAFIFGLLHGFGFAGALTELGLPQKAIPLALLFFNVGVELGQLLFVAVVVTAGALLTRAAIRIPSLRPRWVELATPYAIGGIAMFWVIQRAASFY